MVVDAWLAYRILQLTKAAICVITKLPECATRCETLNRQFQHYFTQFVPLTLVNVILTLFQTKKKSEISDARTESDILVLSNLRRSIKIVNYAKDSWLEMNIGPTSMLSAECARINVIHFMTLS